MRIEVRKTIRLRVSLGAKGISQASYWKDFQKGAKLIGLMAKNKCIAIKKSMKNHLKLKVINPIKVGKNSKSWCIACEVSTLTKCSLDERQKA